MTLLVLPNIQLRFHKYLNEQYATAKINVKCSNQFNSYSSFSILTHFKI